MAMDGELCAIVAGLRAVLPQNEHLKNDFSMHHCVMQNYEDQVPILIIGILSLLLPFSRNTVFRFN